MSKKSEEDILYDEVILYDEIFCIENNNCNEIVKILGIKFNELKNYELNYFDKNVGFITGIHEIHEKLISEYLSCYKQLVDGFFIIDGIDKDTIIFNKCKINNNDISFGSLLIDSSSVPLKENNKFDIIDSIPFSLIKEIYNIIIDNDRDRNSNLFINFNNICNIIILIDDNIAVDFKSDFYIYFIRKEFLILIYNKISS